MPSLKFKANVESPCPCQKHFQKKKASRTRAADQVMHTPFATRLYHPVITDQSLSKPNELQCLGLCFIALDHVGFLLLGNPFLEETRYFVALN